MHEKTLSYFMYVHINRDWTLSTYNISRYTTEDYSGAQLANPFSIMQESVGLKLTISKLSSQVPYWWVHKTTTISHTLSYPWLIVQAGLQRGQFTRKGKSKFHGGEQNMMKLTFSPHLLQRKVVFFWGGGGMALLGNIALQSVYYSY